MEPEAKLVRGIMADTTPAAPRRNAVRRDNCAQAEGDVK